MSTLKANALQDTSGKGFYPARVWVNWNGSGTVAIRDDENTSSITDNGTGQFTVNFSNNMANANFCVSGIGGGPVSTHGGRVFLPQTYTTSSFFFYSYWQPNGGYYDGDYFNVAVNGDM